MKKNKIAFVIPFLIISLNLNAKIIEMNNGGTSYEVKEQDVVELFKKYIEKNKDRLAKKLENAKKKAKERLKFYKPKTLTSNLTRAQENKTFYPDTSYTLDKDIRDINGNVIYPKGYTFNPLNYMNLKLRYIVINFKNLEEVNWLKKMNYDDINTMILLSDGNFIKANKTFGRQVYFLTDKIIDRFNLEHTPSIVVQEGRRLKVQEFYLKSKKLKKDEK